MISLKRRSRWVGAPKTNPNQASALEGQNYCARVLHENGGADEGSVLEVPPSLEEV